jgi:hypothetical protein
MLAQQEDALGLTAYQSTYTSDSIQKSASRRVALRLLIARFGGITREMSST